MKKLFTCLLFVSVLGSASAMTYYVDSTATGGATGLSWQDAFTDLQSALAVAMPGDTILVAQGTYTPGSDPEATFLINKDLTLLGGYPSGGGSPDPVLYETILSGDLNGDDVAGNFSQYRMDNVMTVVTVSNQVTNATLIEGFSIRNGHADGTLNNQQRSGGAIFSNGAPVIRSCRFEQNYALRYGGAIYHTTASGDLLHIENCVFENNQANSGGGVNILEAGFVVKNCDFINNSTFFGALQANGGGIMLTNPEAGLIESCHFSGNDTKEYGAGIFGWNTQFFEGASLDIQNCTYTGNSALSGGGVFFIPYNNCILSVSGCDFNQNLSNFGGGLSLAVNTASDNARFFINNCSFSGNRALVEDGGGLRGLFLGTNTHLEINNCALEQNFAESWGGGISLLDLVGSSGDIQITGCLFQKDSSAFIGGGMTIGGNGSFAFEVAGCQFLENDAAQYAGGLEIYAQSTPKNISIDSCEFWKNTAGNLGGGIGFDISEPGLEAVVRNCRLLENHSATGAAIGFDPSYTLDSLWTQEASILFENCLMTGNSGEAGIVASRKTGNIELLNCTIAGNNADGILLDSFAVITLQNTALYNPGHTEYVSPATNASVSSNGGNLVRDASMNGVLLPLLDKPETDPLFENGYYPSESSPMVNGGVNEGVTAEYDLDGNPRKQGFVDIGAFESSYRVSVREVLAETILDLSPNPAVDEVFVEWPEDISSPVEVRIYDLRGRLLFQENMPIGKGINIIGFPSGLYLLKGSAGGKFFTAKFQKK